MALERQTKVLEGLCELLAHASKPILVTNDIKVDGTIPDPSKYTGASVPIEDFARLHGRLYEARELMDLFSAICAREGEGTSWQSVQRRVEQYRALP
jgi:hypothetical protein